jgi:hypothetical protein
VAAASAVSPSFDAAAALAAGFAEAHATSKLASPLLSLSWLSVASATRSHRRSNGVTNLFVHTD